MSLQCCLYAFALTAVFCSSQSVEERRALNTTGIWSKYNLIVKPTTAFSSETVPPTMTTVVPSDTDARHKLTIVKTKYGYKDEDEDDYDKPYISTHKYHVVSGSEEQHNEYDPDDDDDDEEDDDEGAEDTGADDEGFQASEEQEVEPHRSTTQRSQAIHHKAPIKVAFLDSSTVRSTSNKQKRRKGSPGGSHVDTNHHMPPVRPTAVHDDDENESNGHQKGHKVKGLKKYKVKGLKKLKKYLLPLLLAYKLKFFTLVPLLLGGLVLIVASTGFAGFFFALFAVGVGLKKD